LKIDAGEDGITSFVCELSDDDVETLQRFLDQYEELVMSAPGQNGVPCELTIHVEGGKTQITTTLPTRNELDILFARLRLFMLQDERTSFVKVCAILRRQFTDLRLVELLKSLHAAFHNHQSHLNTLLVINDVEINQEKMLMDWVYGYEQHGDDERRTRLRRLGIDVGHPSICHKLVYLLLNKQRAVSHLAAVVAVIFGRNTHVEFWGATLALDSKR